MAISTEDFVKQIETMTVLDLANLVKALEDRFGVSAAAAAAPVAGARPGAGRGPRGGRGPCRGADRVRRRPQRDRREEDQRDQGRPRGHLARPEGSEGPRRGYAADREGRRVEG